MPLTNANRIENNWYCFKFLATFLAAAAGKISSELRINKPTQEIANVTTTAIITVKIVWVIPVEIPLEDANWGWMEESNVRLEAIHQNTVTANNTMSSHPIWAGVTERMSPIR